jgi:putative glutamine amidotransferase
MIRRPSPPRPVIGISGYREQARWNQWDQPADLIPANYADQVAAAGGTPVVLPPLPGIEVVIGRLDGLIISGGPDVDPSRYGEPAGPHTTVIRPDRDAAETALVMTAIAAGLPVLGICRGLQVINVALGGSLTQHLPDVVGHHGHSPTPGQMGEHEVRIEPGSKLAAILRTERAAVPTHHHQGVDRLAPGLTPLAWADDGIVEAFDFAAPGHGFALAVQWHPEAGTAPGLFGALIAAARERAGAGVPGE